MKLTEIEEEFILFISKKMNKSIERVRELYLSTKNKFGFESDSYKQFCKDNYELNKIIYGEDSDEELLASYKFHALMHTFRFLSYSFPKAIKANKTKKLFSLIKSGDFIKIINYTKRKIKYNQNITEKYEPEDPKLLAQYLLSSFSKTPQVIVDYGCGPAYVSFEIAKHCQYLGEKMPTIYLVDIDSLINEFVIYRFNLHKIPYVKVTVDINNLYPNLPEHQICIASEVMEHIKEPVVVFNNINKKLSADGILFGNFYDHDEYMFHISPHLEELRKSITKNEYKQISLNTYKKPN